MADIVIYTENYPFGNTETFLETEIIYLCRVFDTVYLMPLKGRGNQRPVPVNAKVFEPIILNSKKWTYYAFGLLNLYSLLSDRNLRSGLKKTGLLHGIKYLGYGILIKKKIEKNILKDADIHYSYWLNYNAFALALLKNQKKIKSVICRAHRFDLYEERGEISLDFSKPYTISRIDNIFFISEHGLNYLKNKYPEFSSKYKISRLGTTDPGILNPTNKNDSLIIVSCSSLKPVKRVALILEGLKIFSSRYSQVKLVWYHLGGGSGLDKLTSDALLAFKGSNIQYNFPGNKSNKMVLDFYKTQSLDVFLNTSESEGLPVSIMEAQSFGIPVIATAVGGTPEIVNNENGLLLKADPDPEEIADALYNVYVNKENWLKKRELSRKNWEENFNAEKNYRAFAQELLSLIEPN